MPNVYFVETRQIRRQHKTIQFRAGETYEFSDERMADPEIAAMFKIGHARLVEEPAEEAEQQDPVPAAADQPAAAEADPRRTRRRAGD